MKNILIIKKESKNYKPLYIKLVNLIFLYSIFIYTRTDIESLFKKVLYL